MGNSPQDGGFGRGLIGAQNAAQSKECGVRMNPPVTTLLKLPSNCL